MTKHPWMRAACICFMLAGLAACSSGGGSGGSAGGGGGSDDGGGDDGGGDDGGGGTPPVVSPFTAPTEEQALYFVNEMPTEFNIVRSNHNAGGATPFADLSGLGEVYYDGFMEISIASTPNANIRSATTLSVDMMSGAVSGDASSFMGMVLNSETATHELALYEGAINFSGGTLTPYSNGDTRIDMQVDGALNNGLQYFTLTGTIDGRVYGDEAEGLFASGSYYGLGRDITLTADGADVYGSATLWALKE